VLPGKFSNRFTMVRSTRAVKVVARMDLPTVLDRWQYTGECAARKPSSRGGRVAAKGSMELDLEGKVALITGASRGIGAGIARNLAAAGCDLMLTGRDAKALASVADNVRTLGRNAAVHVADLTAGDEPARLMQTLADEFGRLDVLINNAGAVKRGNFFELTDQDWNDGFNLKFFAHVRLCRLAWPQLKAAAGSVIFIAGIGARAPVADYMIGSSVIGASIAFMKALADLGKRDGVQVNAINPGSVDTDRFRRRLAVIMRKTGLDEAAAIEHHRKELDITRFGTPDDVADLVRFVVSRRGRWLHGSAIDADGGQVVPLRMSVYD
jgi:3-oxoacyl-[acyl-carrier protein] reductase